MIIVGIGVLVVFVSRRLLWGTGPVDCVGAEVAAPQHEPDQLTEEVKHHALGVRAALEASGLDHGPISVHDKMHAMGLDPVPSTASLARIFREAGVARLEPKKKPRSAWRRFVYPARTHAGNSTPPSTC